MAAAYRLNQLDPHTCFPDRLVRLRQEREGRRIADSPHPGRALPERHGPLPTLRGLRPGFHAFPHGPPPCPWSTWFAAVAT
eukprot:40652-Pyramimonas_sp.AAC.1